MRIITGGLCANTAFNGRRLVSDVSHLGSQYVGAGDVAHIAVPGKETVFPVLYKALSNTLECKDHLPSARIKLV